MKRRPGGDTARGLVRAGLGAALALGFAYAGCTLARTGGLAQQCSASAACDDANPCTSESCNTQGTCDYVSLPDGPVPVELQVLGDCAALVCSDGAALSVLDPLDYGDDANGCTDDACGPNGPEHVARLPGASCEDADGNPGECIVKGSDPAGVACAAFCNAANAATVCDDHNDCTQDSCNVGIGVCVHDALNDVLAGAQVAGDCTIVVCSGGAATPVVDDSDRPVDGNDCTEDLCSEGHPSNPATGLNSACGAGGALYCDGQGTCVGCTQDGQCPADTYCRDNSCNQGQCAFANTAPNSVLPVLAQFPGDPNQEAGDCQDFVCDASGGITSAVNTNDKPVDGNVCTTDVCTGTTPSNPPEPVSTTCGVSLHCDGNGQCVGCLNDGECPVDSVCHNWSCNLGTHQCESTTAGAPQPSQIAGDCQTKQCDANGNVVSVPDNADHPSDDGNDCTDDTCSAGVPVHPAFPINHGCLLVGVPAYCNGNGQCVQCTANAQCGLCGCLSCQSGSCGPVTAGTTATCQVPNDCKTNVCDGAGSYTAQNNGSDVPLDDGNDCTLQSCNNGTPVWPPAPGGSTCTQNNGSVCNGEGGCVECFDPSNCKAALTCTKEYVCKPRDGEACGVGGDCASGNCVDSVCCDTPCAQLCRSCLKDQTGVNDGTCSFITALTDPGGECTGSHCCDGSGSCTNSGNCP